MKLDVLLSAMYLENYKYIESLNITGNCVVVNQCDRMDEDVILCENSKVVYIETNERGLSKSRNCAIAHATSDICILCDNDVEYIEDYEKIILKEFEKYPEYDIIAFHVKSDINPVPCYKKYKKLNYLTCGKVISYELAFRRTSIQGIQFNEHIGAGTKYKMGEENAFLFECLRKGLQVLYTPIKIAQLRHEPSTWNTGFDQEYMIARGASFYAMTSKFSGLLILQFAVRKWKLYRGQMTFMQALRYMNDGREEYRNCFKCQKVEKMAN